MSYKKMDSVKLLKAMLSYDTKNISLEEIQRAHAVEENAYERKPSQVIGGAVTGRGLLGIKYRPQLHLCVLPRFILQPAVLKIKLVTH